MGDGDSKPEIRRRLRELYEANPEAFRTVVLEYVEEGPGALSEHRSAAGRKPRPGGQSATFWAIFRTVMNVHGEGQRRAAKRLAAEGGLGPVLQLQRGQGMVRTHNSRSADSLLNDFKAAERRRKTDEAFAADCAYWLAFFEARERERLGVG